MSPLQVCAGEVKKLRGSDPVVIVMFYRDGDPAFYPCLVARAAARNDNYLRSLVRFMQHKVPQP